MRKKKKTYFVIWIDESKAAYRGCGLYLLTFYRGKGRKND